MRTLPYLLALLAMSFVAPAMAETPLEDWRIELNRVRSLAENDIPYAYREAQRLQAAMPVAASAADQARMLNLLTRIEVYLGDTRQAERHAQEAYALAKKNNDRIGQVEADLNVALNAVNQGRFDVMSEAVRRAMTTVDGLDRPDLVGEAMLRTSMMYRRFGRMDDSIEVALKAQAIAKRSRNAFAQAFAYQGVAIAHSLSTRRADARGYYQLMRNAAQEAHSRLLEGDALIGLGSALTGMGDTRSGERLIVEGLALYRKAGGPFYIAHAQHALAESMRQQGRYDEAQKALDESIAIYQSRSNRVGLWWSINLRSEMYRQRGDTARSDVDAEQAYKLAREIGHPYYLGESARMLAARVAGHGNHKRAYALLIEAAEMQARNAGETTSARMLDLAKRFEDEANKREIEDLTRRNELQAVQHYWLWTVLAASLILLVLTVLFVLRLRRSREEIRALNIGLEHRVAERTEALQRSQQSLAEAQRIARLGSWELDIPGNALSWSEEVYRIFEIDPQQFTGTYDAFLDAVHPEDRLNVEQTYRTSLQEKRPYEIEHRILCPDGRVKYVHERCETFFDGNGKPLHSIGTVQDITERKHMEAELKASEARYRYNANLLQTIIESPSSSVAVYAFDREYRLLAFNSRFKHAAKRLWNADIEVGSNVLDAIDTEAHRKFFKQGAEHVLAGNNGFLESNEVRIENGKQVQEWHDNYGSPIRDESGNVVGMTVFVLNTTKRKEAEQKLKESLEFSEGIINAIPDLLFEVDRDGRYLNVWTQNPELLAAQREQLLGKTADEVLSPENAAAAMRAIREADAQGASRIEDICIDLPIGKRWFSHSLSKKPGRISGEATFLVLSRDITERKQLEEQLASRERELRALAESSPGMMGSFYLKPDGTVCMPYVSPNIYELFGLRPEEIAEDAAPLMRLNHPDDALRVMDSIAESARTMSPWRCEYRIIHPTKGERWMEGHTRPYPHPDGGTVWYGYVHDITERKVAEQKLQESLEFSEGIINAIPDLLFEVDSEGRYLNIWTHTPELLAAQKEKLLGRTLQEVLAPESAATAMDALREAAELGSSFGKVIRIDLPQGEGWFELSVSQKPGTQTFLALSRDITARRRMESALSESEARLRALIDNLPFEFWAMDNSLRYIMQNAVSLKHYGSVVGKQIADLGLPSEVAERWLAQDRDVLAGKILHEEYAREVDGELQYFESYTAPVVLCDTVIGIVGASIDITARKRMEEELREREVFLDTLLNAIPIPVFYKDTDGIYLGVNRAYETFFGVSPAQLVGKSVFDTHPKALAEIYHAKDNEVFESGSAMQQYESQIQHKNGTLRDVFFSKAAFFDEQGRVKGLVGAILDITERKQMEVALKTSELLARSRSNLLRAILESSPQVIVFALDTGYRYQAFNSGHREAMRAIWGKEVEMGMNMLDVISLPSDRETAQRAFDRALSGESFVEENAYGDETLKREYWQSYYSPIRSESGEITGLTCFVLNISARKRLEAELLASRNFLNSVLDAVPDPVFVKDRLHNWVMLNDAFCRFIGHPAPRLLGKSDYDFFPKEEADVFWEKDEVVFDSGEVNLNEEDFTSADGVTHFIQTKKTPFISAAGEQMLVGVIRDITERKQFEIAREMALTEAQRLAKLRSDFIAHMSHELRTPLNGILGYAQMLGRDGKLGKKQIASVDVIRHSGEHLLSLIEDILDLARIESGKLELHQSDIPLRHFLQVIERMIAIRAREKNLECVGEYAADLPTGIRGDEKRLRQVLLNLLSNAVKFTAHGKVVLSVSRVAPSRLAFAVSDTGVGISASQQEHLFQPFGQVGDAQQRAEGTGLGLAISRQLVRLMGGDITLESHPGDGSTFRFELDLPEVVIQPETAKHTGKTAHGRHTGTTEPVPLLIAPPEAEMRELHRLALLGNMRDIINHTAQIGSLDPRYRPFADHLKHLAEGYQSKAILAFVEEYLK